MMRFWGSVLAAVLMLIFGWLAASQAQTPRKASATAKKNLSQMTNKNARSVWAYRHDPVDRNGRNQALAIKIYFDEPNQDGFVTGSLRFWTDYNNGHYTDASMHSFTLPLQHVTNAGQAGRAHEHCSWTATPVTAGDSSMTVRVSLFKSKDNQGAGDPHRRLVVRFQFGNRDKDATDNCCDEDPDDDVLQEDSGTDDDTPPDP